MSLNKYPKSLQGDGHCRDRLRVNQAVELQGGALTGMRGVLIDFRGDHRCPIELDDVPKGVFLVIDCASVKGLLEGEMTTNPGGRNRREGNFFIY